MTLTTYKVTMQYEELDGWATYSTNKKPEDETHKSHKIISELSIL